MIKCYLCPLNDVCTVTRIVTTPFKGVGGPLPSVSELELNWLPDGGEEKCPLYRTTKVKEES